MSEGRRRLVVAGTARRDIGRVPEKYATAIVELLPSIAANPQRLGRPLRFEWEGRWAARRGPYRVIYEIDEEARTVTVLAVAHRADVYRRRWLRQCRRTSISGEPGPEKGPRRELEELIRLHHHRIANPTLLVTAARRQPHAVDVAARHSGQSAVTASMSAMTRARSARSAGSAARRATSAAKPPRMRSRSLGRRRDSSRR